jgi:hypothetical protein
MQFPRLESLHFPAGAYETSAMEGDAASHSLATFVCLSQLQCVPTG